MSNDHRNKSAGLESEKRPYRRPRLYVYGDVNKLTRAQQFWPGTQDGQTGMIGQWDVPLRS